LAIFLPLILLLNLGCGPASRVNLVSPLTKKSIVSPNQGVVIARVIDASGARLPFNYLTITPKNINESKEVKWQRLESLTPQMNGSTIFGSSIAAGSYSLSSTRSFYSFGNYWYERNAFADPKFGTFEVKPNQVTDLGTIIYYTKPQDDRYSEILLHLPGVELGEVLGKYFPFFQYDKNKLLSWNDDGLEEERESLFLSVAQNPIAYNKSYLSPDKSLYFLGKFGMIIKRTNYGDWELDSVDTNLDLTSIAENKFGDLIVGGSEGKLFFKPTGQSWFDISMEQGTEILSVVFNQESNIDLIIKNNNALLIMRADSRQQPLVWQEINRYDYREGWKHSNIPPLPKSSANRRIFSASLSTIGKKHYIDINTKHLKANTLFTESRNQIFEYSPNDWSVTEPEGELEVSTVVDAGATKLGIKKAGFWSWSGRSTYYRYLKDSDDWDKISTNLNLCANGKVETTIPCDKPAKGRKIKKTNFNLRSIPWFKNELEAVAIAGLSDYNAWTGERSSETKIIYTKDGGKKWIDTGYSLPKPYCSNVISKLTDRIILSCNGATGDFYESTDNGKTWQQVREQENF
jgi:hypothetical protein